MEVENEIGKLDKNALTILLAEDEQELRYHLLSPMETRKHQTHQPVDEEEKGKK